MQLFYTTNIQKNIAIINGQENIHLTKVLRKNVGDEVFICNGEGGLFKAVLSSISKKESVLDILETIEQQTENSSQLILAVAPTKNMDRYEWMIEKSVEIGVNKIIPFYSQNSERRRLKLERLEGIAVAAMKQSKTLFLPIIAEPVKYKDLLTQNFSEQKFIAYLRDNTEDVTTSFPQLKPELSTVVLIGPEGGFTVEEAEQAVKNKFKTLSLGSKRLRTETAGVFTASAYQLLCK